MSPRILSLDCKAMRNLTVSCTFVQTEVPRHNRAVAVDNPHRAGEVELLEEYRFDLSDSSDDNRCVQMQLEAIRSTAATQCMHARSIILEYCSHSDWRRCCCWRCYYCRCLLSKISEHCCYYCCSYYCYYGHLSCCLLLNKKKTSRDVLMIFFIILSLLPQPQPSRFEKRARNSCVLA